MLPLLTSAALCAAPASFTDQVFQATAVVEWTVEVAPAGKSKTSEEARVLDSLQQKRAVSRVLVPAGRGDGPAQWPAPALRRWRPVCPGEGPLALLALYAPGADGTWTAVALDGQARGRGTDRDVGYNLVVEAVVEARQWQEERMRAVGAELLWQRERAALRADNPYLRALAVAFLSAHGAADVVDKEWGASGTAARKAEEAKARLPEPACARPPDGGR